MNNVEPQKSTIAVAVTFTTATNYAGKVNRVKPFTYVLVRLLQQYKHMYEDFSFYTEIFDESYRSTKIHFHGELQIKLSEVYEFSKFCEEYEKKTKTSQTVTKEIWNDKWSKYIRKHSVIHATYEKLGIKRIINPKTLKSVHKWCKPVATPTSLDTMFQITADRQN